MTAQEILRTKRSFAIVGATQNPERYGYEVFAVLRKAGYNVFPVNPKYEEIDEIKCYPSLKALPQKPDVVISALAPANTEKVTESVKELGVEILWMPPGCWSEESVEKCKILNINFVHDVCPVGIVKMMEAK